MYFKPANLRQSPNLRVQPNLRVRPNRQRSRVDLLESYRPSMLADFARNRYYADGYTTYGDLVTFSRASGGTYFDANGNMQLAASGAPRFDHDPVSGVALGQLLEGQRTNLLTHSVCNNTAGWSVTGASSANLSLNALGQFNGVTVTSNGVDWSRLDLDSDPSVTNGTDYVITFFYQGGTSGKVRINLRDPAASSETRVGGALGNPTITTATGGSGDASVLSDEVLSDGLTHRTTILYTPNFTGICTLGIGPNSNTSGETVIALGAQLELGSYATSYIPTSGATATRLADVATIDLDAAGLDLSGGYTVLVEATLNAVAGNVDRIFQIDNGSEPVRQFVYYETSSGRLWCQCRDGANISGKFAIYTLGTPLKSAGSFSSGELRTAFNGDMIGTPTAANFTPGNVMRLGRSSTGEQPTSLHLKRIAIFTPALSDAKMEALTQP